MVCALAAETKEAEYLAMLERHKDGKRAKRGVDLMGQMLGGLVDAIEKYDADVLGDLFQGSITYGEAGQYSPRSRCVHDASRFALRDRLNPGLAELQVY